MDVFMLAAIVGVAVTLLALVSTVEQLNNAIGYRLRTIFHASFPRRAANLFVVTVASILILVVVFIAIGPIHPRETRLYGMAELLRSRQFASIVLGLLFGIFLVFWIRQLLLLKEDESVTWLHRGEAIFIILLLVLGAFSDQIASLTQRLTQFSAAGVTLQFEALKGIGGADRGQQGHGGTTEKGQSASALYFLSSLHGEQGILTRDRHYIDSMAKASSPASAAQSTQSPTPATSGANAPPSYKDPSDDFFRETVGVLAACLSGVVEETHEDGEANNRLLAIKPIIREISYNRGLGPGRVNAAAEKLVIISMGQIDELGRTYLGQSNKLRTSVLDACSPLIILRCPEVEKELPAKNSNQEPKLLLDAINRCTKDHAKQTDALEKTMKTALSDQSLFERPYLALLYASILWRLEDYDAAVKVLEDWIKTSEKNSKDAAMRWYSIRVRTTLTVILEDWIRSSGNPPPLILIHHLANVHETITQMEAEDYIRTAWKAFTEKGHDLVERKFAQPIWASSCSLTDDQIRLATTFLRQHMVYAYRATQHPEYFDRFARDVLSRMDSVMKLDLSCLDRKNATLLYAELLQIYAEVEIANAVRIAKLPDAQEARLRLRNASDAARLGYDMVFKDAKDQEDQAPTTVIRDQKATELRYLLDRADRRAREALSQ